jgi:hypothetical protein
MGKIPKAILIERNQFGFDYYQSKKIYQIIFLYSNLSCHQERTSNNSCEIWWKRYKSRTQSPLLSIFSVERSRLKVRFPAKRRIKALQSAGISAIRRRLRRVRHQTKRSSENKLELVIASGEYQRVPQEIEPRQDALVICIPPAKWKLR